MTDLDPPSCLDTEPCACDTAMGRRDFLRLATGVAVGGACYLAVPAHDAEAASGPKEVDLSEIKEGETKTVLWQGKPVFIRRRSMAEIKALRAMPVVGMIDPARDEDRVAQSTWEGKPLPEWLVATGSCPHLGCVPRAISKEGQTEWFCSCHGSRFDASGRVMNGPAEKNLAIPAYRFIAPLRIMIG